VSMVLTPRSPISPLFPYRRSSDLGGRHQHVLDRDSGSLMSDKLCLIKDFPGDETAVNHHQSQLRLAVIENERPGVKLILNGIGKIGRASGRERRYTPVAPLPLAQS